MPSSRDFADYCCELLAGAGPCVAKRMFGGWGLSIDGVTIAIISDLGSGEKLWLKADEASIARFEAARCERFSYTSHKAGVEVQRSMNYYSAPEEALESAQAMAHWARLALDSALQAQQPRAKSRSRQNPRA